jgi:predicted GNAT family acetyltransferase
MELTVRKGDNRYELVEDGVVIGFAEYQVRGDAVVLPHTVIDPDRRGEGLGAVLVQGALDDVRPAGRTVVPACWYVRQFIDAHPEYADLLA